MVVNTPVHSWRWMTSSTETSGYMIPMQSGSVVSFSQSSLSCLQSVLVDVASLRQLLFYDVSLLCVVLLTEPQSLHEGGIELQRCLLTSLWHTALLPVNKQSCDLKILNEILIQIHKQDKHALKYKCYLTHVPHVKYADFLVCVAFLMTGALFRICFPVTQQTRSGGWSVLLSGPLAWDWYLKAYSVTFTWNGDLKWFGPVKGINGNSGLIGPRRWSGIRLELLQEFLSLFPPLKSNLIEPSCVRHILPNESCFLFSSSNTVLGGTAGIYLSHNHCLGWFELLWTL